MSEGRYLDSLSPSGSTIFDERSGLGTARPQQPFRSYLFDGADDHIVINGSASWVFPNMSFGAWVYRSDWSVSRNAGIITKGLNTQWGLFLEGTSLKVRIGAPGSDIISSVSSLTAGWHHLFVTVEGTTSRIYIDGAEVASGTTNSMPTANANNVQIGRFLSVWPFSGQMSDTRLYSDTKTPAEVLAIKNQGFDISDMVDWWKLDDTHDTIAYGCFAGNNGTKTNITTGTGPGTFHAEGGTGWLPDSWQNRVGYSDSANGPVPRDESDTANDVLGDQLDYVGPVPRNAVAINSNCVEFDGADDYVTAPVTMLSSQAWEVSAKLYIDSDATGDCTFIGSSSNDSVAFRYRTSTNTWFVAYGGFIEGINSWQVAGSAMTDDEFHDVVIGWDGVDTLSMSIDGVSMGTKVLTAPAASVPLKIGNRWVTAAFWDGRMSDVKFTQNSVLLLHLPLSEGEGTDHYNAAGGSHAQAINTGGGYRVTDSNARPSNLLDGCSKVTYLDGTDDFISADVGTFYEDNDTLEIEFELVKLDSGTSSIISIGEDNSNLIQVTGWNGGTQLRIMGQFSGSDRAMNLTSPELGVYKVAVTKATETIIVTKPDGSTQEDDLTSLGVAGRANGSLYIGKRPVLDDNFSDAIIRDVKLNDSSGTIVHHWHGYGHENWDDQVGSADGSVTGAVSMWIPAKSSSLDALGLTLTNPAGAFHNGAETQINFKPEPGASWVHQWESAGELLPTAYSYGDLLPANMSKVVDGLTERLFSILTPGEITPSPATAVATVVNPSVALGPAPVSPLPAIAICTTVSPVVVESILNTVAPVKVVADLRRVTVVGR